MYFLQIIYIIVSSYEEGVSIYEISDYQQCKVALNILCLVYNMAIIDNFNYTETLVQSIIFNFYYFKLTTTNMEVHSKYASFQYETNNLLLNKCLKKVV